MKFFLLAIVGFMPTQQIFAETATTVTCTRSEYREEYIAGTRSQPGYVRTYEVDVEVPCGGQTQVQVDNNDCSEGTFIGGLIGAGLGLANSSGNDRFWAVPGAATAGALIGCQIDGG